MIPLAAQPRRSRVVTAGQRALTQGLVNQHAAATLASEGEDP